MKTRPLKIVGLGDSTTAGSPAFASPLEAPPAGRGNPESQYGFWMSRLHPEWEVLNRGVNRERSDELLRRLPRDGVQTRPDYLIVLGGVNDIYQGRSVESIRTSLSEIYSGAGKARIRVVAATVLPFDTMSPSQGEFIRELNHWIQSEAKARGLLFCDTYAAVCDSRDANRLSGSPDGLHPDVAGYRKMGEALARVLEASELHRAANPSR
jgi:lysophospholipase L1-like esterase